MNERLIQIQVKCLNAGRENLGEYYGFQLLIDVFLEAITFLQYEYGCVNMLCGQGVLFVSGPDYFSEVVVVILEGAVGINAGGGDVVGLGLRTDELLDLTFLHLNRRLLFLLLLLSLLIMRRRLADFESQGF